MNKSVVTGGTGVLGSVLVQQLREQDKPVVIASRHPVLPNAYSQVADTSAIPWSRVDLAAGEGLADALDGADTVFHLAGGTRKIGGKSVEVVAIEHLLAAARKARIKHLVCISIVGVDRIPFSYYRVKETVESLVQQSTIPYTILRVTQFHDFVDHVLGMMMRFAVGLVPKKMRIQPISVPAAATHLRAVGESGPQHRILTIGGREAVELGVLAAQWQHYRGQHKPVFNIPIVGKALNAWANGYGTCPEIAEDSSTWEEYLAQRYRSWKPESVLGLGDLS